MFLIILLLMMGIYNWLIPDIIVFYAIISKSYEKNIYFLCADRFSCG